MSDRKNEEKHLLQAAIINNQPMIVEQILESSNTPSDILDDASDTWPPPLQLAGISGNLEILTTLFSTRRFKSLAKMRGEALKGAVAEGRLQIVKFICDPQWGPMDIVSANSPVLLQFRC
jgi:hypothetical protein